MIRLTETRTVLTPNGIQEIVVDIEPFGFVDGISQPLFLTSQLHQLRQRELGATDKVIISNDNIQKHK